MDGNFPVDQPVLPIAELEAQITELAGHLNAGNYRWLSLIAEFDRRKGWATSMLPSCAHWLSFKCGIDLGAAREKVRTALALEALPKISASMARGELSYSKVRALTRVASPANEEYFQSIALAGTVHHVETLVRLYRRAQEAEALSKEAQQQAGRSVHYHFDLDGSLVLNARLPAESGALLLKALNVAMEDIPGPGASDVSREIADKKPSFPMRRADALGLIAESFIKHGIEALSGGDRHQVVIHVDAETLRNNTAGRCELEDGPSIPAETARRLACDASVVSIVENERGEPLNVTYKTRSIPPALRRALNARDQG